MRVEKRLDGSLAVRFRDRYLTIAECVPQPKAAVSPTGPKARVARRAQHGSSWMKGFNLQKSPPLWSILQQEKGRGRTAS